MPLPVAVNGTISLLGSARQGDAPQPLTKRAMIIRMSEETLEALAAYPAHPPLQFEFGDSPGIHIGSTFFPMQGAQESTPHELYLRSALASKINAPLKLYADIAGKFIVGRELNGKAESKVHQSTADAQKSKSGGRIRVLDAPPTLAATKAKSSAPSKKRKSAVSAPIAATVRRVPHVVRAKNEGSSAARGQSPPPPPPASQSSPVSPAMRAQMIHLLAKGSRTKEDVLTQVGGSKASEALRVQLNELLVTIAERERSSSKTLVPGQPPVYALLPVSWKEVRPYEFPGLTEEERRKMWLQARQALYTLGIPESDAAWDYVRTRPGSTATGASKVVVGAKRATGTIGADRKKNIGSTSKGPVEAKDEGVRPVQTNRAREDAVPVSRPTKPNPKREDDDAAVVPRRPPGTSVSKIVARESVPSQPQAQGPSKKAGPTDVRVKRDETSKMSRRPTPVQSSSSREREQEREKPTIVAKKREHDSDLDREKAKTGPTHKVKKRKDIASDMESLRDWDGTDTGKTGLKRKKLREDYDDKDRVNGTGTTVKRRKMADEDRPYKPGSSSSGVSKVRERERERDRESDRGHDKAGDRDTHPTSKRPRGSDRGSAEPPPPLPRKLAVRDREPRQREREPERSISPPRRVKREPSPSPQSSLQRDNSPLPRVSVKRTDSPLRDVVKREPSPPPRLLPRRDDTPLSVRNSKRGASPPRPPARKRDRDRDRESSVTTRRRRSPIYTSSEDDPGTLAVRRNAPSSVTSSSSSRDVMRNSAFTPHPQPPSAPYPKDRESLQSRYRKGYRNYIAVYHQWSEERAKIEDALADLGREGSFSDGDVEMMDEEGLRELADRYAAWTRELEGIRNAYSAVVERMDMAT